MQCQGWFIDEKRERNWSHKRGRTLIKDVRLPSLCVLSLFAQSFWKPCILNLLSSNWVACTSQFSQFSSTQRVNFFILFFHLFPNFLFLKTWNLNIDNTKTLYNFFLACTDDETEGWVPCAFLQSSGAAMESSIKKSSKHKYRT